MKRERGRRPRKRVCSFCVDKVESMDYKETHKVRKYVTDRGKILPRRISGNCAMHQRQVTLTCVALDKTSSVKHCSSTYWFRQNTHSLKKSGKLLSSQSTLQLHNGRD